MHGGSHTGRRLFALVGSLGLSLVFAACAASSSPSGSSSSTSKSTNTKSTNKAQAGDQSACAFISPSEITATMGVTVSRPISVVRGSVTTCSYKAPDPTHSVIIEFDTAANETSFASGRSTIESHHVTTTSIPGLGSGAYSFSERTSQNTVSTVVTFQGSLQTFVTGTSSMAQVTSMAEEILYKLDAHNTSTTSTISTTSATGATSTTSASG